ncbi:MAG TPA: hypothetical protein VFV86_08235 [Nitrososphaeraceae archaeon]|nr:hypothetical protein [Nitrososphaeraceae archaeon]
MIFEVTIVEIAAIWSASIECLISVSNTKTNIPPGNTISISVINEFNNNEKGEVH